MPGYLFMKALPTPSAVCVSKCAVYQLTCPSFLAASTSAASAARAREMAAGAKAASAVAAALASRNLLRFIVKILPRSLVLPRLLRPDFPRAHPRDRERHYPPSPGTRQGGSRKQPCPCNREWKTAVAASRAKCFDSLP